MFPRAPHVNVLVVYSTDSDVTLMGPKFEADAALSKRTPNRRLNFLSWVRVRIESDPRKQR